MIKLKDVLLRSQAHSSAVADLLRVQSLGKQLLYGTRFEQAFEYTHNPINDLFTRLTKQIEYSAERLLVISSLLLLYKTLYFPLQEAIIQLL